MSLLLASAPVSAQYLTRPQIPWRTITTERFDIHYPVEMEEWTRRVALRMESYADAVNAVVGNSPESRITVIVEDPSNVANGFALPFMEGPVIFLWPTPPSPSPTFGTHRGWGEALAVHEYAHIAHLTFPSRNTSERFWWRFLPTRISPVAIKAPAWIIEGYATLIEGQLTGSGRPFSAGRAAILRQWALEGRLPTYAQLNGSGAFLGGNMRYLAGSAFLEWLEQQRGDSSLVHLWRRMTARQQRSFDEAFAGVFGVSAPEMYATFTVDLTERSLKIRNRLRNSGIVEGELIQRLSGATGEPALSPDGSRLAIVLRRLNGPSRLVVMETKTPGPDSALQRARERLLERDSLDVLPFDSFPRPRRALATLRPVNGRSHESPRWMPDGITLLVSRDEPAPNGITRPDLFLWNSRARSLRRVTHGAGIRQADPAPGGQDAAGVRCHAGSCSVVMVSLTTGAWRELVPGKPDLVWHRPRFSPDGSSIAASYQEHGLWGIALIDPRTGVVRRLTSESSRHSPAFTPDGRSLIVVSEHGGIPNLESVPIDSGPVVPLTRVTGAVLAPDVSRADGSTWFLTLRSGGYDLRRVERAAALPTAVVAIRGALTPAAPPTPRAPELDSGVVGPLTVQGYGLGPRRWRVLPGGTIGPGGGTATLMVANIDPIGRLSVVMQGAAGPADNWRGVSAAAALRRTAVSIEPSLWWFAHEPSRSRRPLSLPALDIRSRGIGIMARLGGEGSRTAYALRVGAAAGQLSNNTLVDAARFVASGEARGRAIMSLGPASFSVTAGVSSAAGTTGGDSWVRTVGSGTVVIGTSRLSLRGDWSEGVVTAPADQSLGRTPEQFLLGGPANPLLDGLYHSQRVAIPAVPAGFASGTRFQVLRAALGGRDWEPYFLWITAGDSLTGRKRVAGIERSFSIASLGFARLPAIRARAGAAWSFDEPYRHRARGYLSLTFSP